MIIKPYNLDYDLQTWNNFIANSRQGTFLLNRNFMDYHSDRFVDYSLMFYDHNGKLVAVLPANINDNIIFSHQGLSYGGLVYGEDTKVVDVLNCFISLKAYAQNHQIKKIIYKRIPYIYHNYTADEDLYALFLNDAILIRRDIGFVIDNRSRISWNNLRKRSLKKAIKEQLTVKVNEDYISYHKMLSEVLGNKYNTRPVHSIEEMQNLSGKFPQNIRLICSFIKDKMLSGVWIFIEKDIIHTQYIVVSEEGKKCGALEIVMDFLLKEYSNKKYLSFGISTEKSGQYLNEGLSWQKESLGGRGICYDFYELRI